jgi:hypothetical protein
MDPYTADMIATGRRETLRREAENERVARDMRCQSDSSPTPQPRPRPASRPATA